MEGYPKTASELRVQISDLAPELEFAGVGMEQPDHKEGKQRLRRTHLWALPDAPDGRGLGRDSEDPADSFE